MDQASCSLPPRENLQLTDVRELKIIFIRYRVQLFAGRSYS
jgi:hypothetical protein